MSWRITASVGAWERGARNHRRDVETIQTLLLSAAANLSDATISPGGVDGDIARPPKQSGTIKAIKAFQQHMGLHADGLVDVNGRTWNTLVREAGEGPGSANPHEPGKLYFPFSQLPKFDWSSGARAFGSNRSQGKRAHAGCDLYFPQGTWIHAITEGTVLRGPYWFYAQTYALEVDHGDFVVRYGEVQPDSPVRAGDRVQAGQKIARVGRLVGISVPSDMLHIEMYDKSAAGPLTVDGPGARVRPDGVSFSRRKDLIDPTPHLNGWKSAVAIPY